ncbi:hypothetical protein [Streptosporangium saharense]|uniref:hypothetical protein n=1 Tax=Streptosporangium saharense TaxID=1706840 RepID=UPI003328C8C5
MTRLRRALHGIAEEAPAVDMAALVDQAVAGRRRRRRAPVMMAAAAMVATVVTVVATGTVMTAVRSSQPHEMAAPGITDLPEGNVGPLGYAYETPCKVDKKENVDCGAVEWRVVTGAGETYRLPQALAMTSKNHRVPVAVSRDGSKLAYYSRKDRAHVVRDLVSGARVTSPVTVKESRIGPGSTLALSDDGRYVVFDPREGSRDPGLLIEVGTGKTVKVPGKYEAIGVRDGVVELVRYIKTDLWLMPVTGGGKPVRFDGAFMGFSELAPDGRTVAAFERRDEKKWIQELRTLVLLDVGTGRKLRSVPIRGLPEGRPVMFTGPWRSGSELTVVVDGTQRMYAYGVDIGTGKAHPLTDYPNALYLTLPGIVNDR